MRMRSIYLGLNLGIFPISFLIRPSGRAWYLLIVLVNREKAILLRTK